MIDSNDNKICNNEELLDDRLISALECSKILGVSYDYAKKIMGMFDSIELTKNNVTKNMYLLSRVLKKRDERFCIKCRKQSQKGKCLCYICRNKFNKEDIHNNQCNLCIAKRVVCNYLCKNNCVKNTMDCSLLINLKNAIKEIEKNKNKTND